MQPATTDGPHLFQCLSKEEFHVVFAVAFLEANDLFDGSYPISAHASEDHPGETLNWIELFKRAIRYLNRECGMGFSGIDVYPDGELAVEMVEPRNWLYVTMMGDLGMLPNPEKAIELAIELQPHRMPGLNVQPMREALAVIEQHKRSIREQINPDAARALMEFREAALRGAGEEIN